MMISSGEFKSKENLEGGVVGSEDRKRIIATKEIFIKLERAMGVDLKMNKDGKRKCTSLRCAQKEAIDMNRFLLLINSKDIKSWRDHRFCDECRREYRLFS